jgi:hypothetical protein
MLTKLILDLDFFNNYAFAWEGWTRAYAVAGNPGQAKKAIEKALQLAGALSDKEDREIFYSELNERDWDGVR